jgi:cystathionine gamma-synthase
VVGYEEGEPDIVEALQLGYPRFFFNPAVTRATQGARQDLGLDDPCLLFPTAEAARLAEQFIRSRESDASLAVHSWRGVHALAFPERCAATAKLFWQHAGLGISSRRALSILDSRSAPSTASTGASKETLRRRIAGLAAVEPSDVRLFGSGMAAVHGALRSLMAMRPGLPTAQLCFPYLDSLKLQQALIDGVCFHPGTRDEDVDALAKQLNSTRMAGIFTEIPSNPLLQTVDSEKLAALARGHDVPIVVDDSIGSLYNQDCLRLADIVVLSLTKYFAGRGDVMGGALIVNPRSRYRDAIISALDTAYEDTLFEADADALELGSRDFAERMDRVNQTTSALCERLVSHPAIAEVFHPSTQSRANYDALRKKGHGGLFSIVLRDAANTTPGFYDRLRVAKGPSFGMTQTLACPYTLLAHYGELEWAEAQGVSRYLVRFSVGLEDYDELYRVIAEALPT